MLHNGLLTNTLVGAKRTRREFEPDSKGYNDDALEMPWEDLQLIPLGGHYNSQLGGDDCGIEETKRDDGDSLLYMGRKIQALSSFLIKNIYFFSHATEVQAHTIPIFRQPGNSIVVEAATGSGKTLAFLLPVFERILFSCHSVVSTLGVPMLSRDIVSVVLSPSRVLATQTFVVAKKFANRLPFGVGVSLCDGLVEPAEKVLMHLRKQRRGVGTVLITTPGDLMNLIKLMSTTNVSEVVSGGGSSDEEEVEEYMDTAQSTSNGTMKREPKDKEATNTNNKLVHNKKGITIQEDEDANEDPISYGPNNKPQTKIISSSSLSFARMLGVFPKMVDMGALNTKFCVNHAESKCPLQASHTSTYTSSDTVNNKPPVLLQPLPFVLVIDEADVVLKAPNMRRQVEEFMEYLEEGLHHSSEEEGLVTCNEVPNREDSQMTHIAKSKNKKKNAVAAENKAIHLERKSLPKVDVGVFGATVGSSANVEAFVKKYGCNNCPQKIENNMRGRDLLNTHNEASPVAVKKKGKGVVAVTDERQKLLANGSAQDHSESLFRVVLHTNDDFISLLQNQYIVTPVSDYLHTLIHLLNLHPNRKHFIFFDSIPVLLYVRAIMEHLVRKGGNGTGTSLSDPNRKKRQKQCVSAADSGVVSFGSASGSSGLERKAVLYVSKIFSMHEDMNENTKFNEYNGFLEHQCGSSGGRLSAAGASSLTSKIFAHKRDRLVRSQEKAAGNNTSHQRLSDSSISMAELKNARYTGGLKRDAFSSTGTGAVLLCTDEAAFGLDVRDVDYVYHAEVPRTVRSYIHRIGRVGRMGMRGSSIMILAGDGANETEKLDVDDRLTTTSNDVPLCDTALPHHHLPVSAAEEENTYNKAGSYRTLANSHTGRKLLTAMSAGSLASRRGRSALQRINDDLNDPMKAATTQEEAEIELRMMLTKEQKDFVEKLKAAKSLERYKLPHVALLTPTLRAVVAGDPNVVKLGRKAAMALAHFGENKQNPVSESAVKKLRSDKSQRNENDAVSINSEGKYEDDNEGDGFSWFSPKASLDALLLSQYKS